MKKIFLTTSILGIAAGVFLWGRALTQAQREAIPCQNCNDSGCVEGYISIGGCSTTGSLPDNSLPTETRTTIPGKDLGVLGYSYIQQMESDAEAAGAASRVGIGYTGYGSGAGIQTGIIITEGTAGCGDNTSVGRSGSGGGGRGR